VRILFNKYGVDVRSLRYPGLISWKSAPGGGTTDYAVHIFHEALKSGSYTCFLSENTELPMMYMPDAIKATIDIMQVPAQKIKFVRPITCRQLVLPQNRSLRPSKSTSPNSQFHILSISGSKLPIPGQPPSMIPQPERIGAGNTVTDWTKLLTIC